MPRPSSPPGAKASTRCPSLAQSRSPTTHRNNQRPHTVAESQTRTRKTTSSNSAHTHKTPLNPAPSARAAPPINDRKQPGQTNARAPTIRTTPRPPNQNRNAQLRQETPESSCAPRSAPEPDSQHKRPNAYPAHRHHAPPIQRSRSASCTEPLTPRHQTPAATSRLRPLWRRPLETPSGDDRVRTDDPLLAKQVLSQLSYAPSGNPTAKPNQGPGPRSHTNKAAQEWAREDLNLRPHAYQACALTS